jgi:integrase/recombinase XerC/integrase/recombinase XerD
VTAIDQAIAAWVTHLEDAGMSPGTVKQYRNCIRRLVPHMLDGCDVALIEAEEILSIARELWGGKDPATWNRARNCLRSAWKWWGQQGWCDGSEADSMPRRTDRGQRDRTIPIDLMRKLLTSRAVPLREKVLWTMLYETAARVSEVLALDIGDCDFPRHSAAVVRKGGAEQRIHWRSSSAILIPRYLKDATAGPMFVSSYRSHAGKPLADLDPDGFGRLSYRQAADDFAAISKRVTKLDGLTLHMIRHTAASEAIRQGTPEPVVKAWLGHSPESRATARYITVSDADLAHWQAGRDENAVRKGGGR